VANILKIQAVISHGGDTSRVVLQPAASDRVVLGGVRSMSDIHTYMAAGKQLDPKHAVADGQVAAVRTAYRGVELLPLESEVMPGLMSNGFGHAKVAVAGLDGWGDDRIVGLIHRIGDEWRTLSRPSS